MARPKVNDDVKRRAKLTVRLAGMEYVGMQWEAKQRDISVSDLAYELLKDKIVEYTDKATKHAASLLETVKSGAKPTMAARNSKERRVPPGVNIRKAYNRFHRED